MMESMEPAFAAGGLDYAMSSDMFAAQLGLGPEGAEFLNALPDEVRERVMRSFSPEGTKDGDVLGRLKGFAKSIMQRAFLAGAAFQHTPPVAAFQHVALPPAGGFASATSGSVAQYAFSIGLDELGASYLASWPQEVQTTVMAEFDPRGTKDGNVFGRLLGFARAVWVQRLGFDAGLRQEANAILRQLPDEGQAKVMSQFDASGTKDGNVLARLQRFAHGVAARLGSQGGPGYAMSSRRARWPAQAHGGGYGGAAARSVSAAPAGGFRPGQVPQYSGSAGSGGDVDPALLSAFAQQNALTVQQMEFMQALPQEVVQSVLTSFDPAGTKDGNIWGRLFGFIRTVWTKHLGLDKNAVNFLKTLSLDVQEVVMAKFDPSTTKDGNVAARLEVFAKSVAKSSGAPVPSIRAPPPIGRVVVPKPATIIMASSIPPARSVEELVAQWELSADAAVFLAALPEFVQQAVLSSFRAVGTKDGNVWGRMLGFARSVWSKQVGLDKRTVYLMRGLPEEVQMSLMVSFAEETPAQIIAERVREESIAHGGDAYDAAVAVDISAQPGSDVAEFVDRCNLGVMGPQVAGFLLGLDPEVRSVVLSEFDPGGTKDGNIFGRLKGFAAAVDGKRKRQRGVGFGGFSRNVRPRW